MIRWLKRVLTAVFLMAWVIILLFPCMAFNLAMQGEIQIGGNSGNHIRLFLLSEKETEGIGVEWQRPFFLNPSCSQTSVTYFLWVGEGENAQFCQCVDPLTGNLSATVSPTCQIEEGP